MNTELDPIIYSYRTYGKDPDKYIGIAQIHQYFDKGFIYGMFGKETFYCIWEDFIDGKLKDVGIKVLEGYIMEPTLRMVTARANKFKNAIVKITRSVEWDGRKFYWIELERIDGREERTGDD